MTHGDVVPPGEIHVWIGPRTSGHERIAQLLARHAGDAFDPSTIARTALGKPYVIGCALHFSVSHSGACTAIAASAGPVGLDIERMLTLPDLDDVAAATFGGTELERLRTCAPEHRQSVFYQCWTRKEAMLKAIGCGLSIDPRQADTLAAPAWQFHAVSTIPGYAGCVATMLEDARVVVHAAS